MGGVLQQAALMPLCGNTAGTLMDEEEFSCPPVIMLTEVVFFLKEWAPSWDLGEVEVTPETVIEALHEIGRSLEK